MVGCALLAAALMVATYWLPLWTMRLEAPQYPNGLFMRAYGHRVAGDLYEINIINHYVGMAEIAEVPAPEMALFPYAVFGLAAACVLSLLHRRLMQLTALAVLGMPVVVLADLQWWLHKFGRNLDPHAPLNFVKPFTPLVIGISKIGNFRSVSMISWGLLATVIAAALLWIGLRAWPAAKSAVAKSASATVAEEPAR